MSLLGSIVGKIIHPFGGGSAEAAPATTGGASGSSAPTPTGSAGTAAAGTPVDVEAVLTGMAGLELHHARSTRLNTTHAANATAAACQPGHPARPTARSTGGWS